MYVRIEIELFLCTQWRQRSCRHQATIQRRQEKEGQMDITLRMHII